MVRRRSSDGDDVAVTSKDGWRVDAAVVKVSPLPVEAERVIAVAARLTRGQIIRLDLAERESADFRLVAWDVLRSNLRDPGTQPMRMDARERAWAAVNDSLATLGVEALPGDDYWRVTTGFGWGAARAARFAACTLVAPDRVDPEVAELLLRPWLAVATRRRDSVLEVPESPSP